MANALELNERYIRFRGSVPIDQEIEMGKDYEITMKISCCEIIEKNKEDGTIDRIFKVLPTEIKLNN
jgi:hypothetical protein